MPEEGENRFRDVNVPEEVYEWFMIGRLVGDHDEFLADDLQTWTTNIDDAAQFPEVEEMKAAKKDYIEKFHPDFKVFRVPTKERVRIRYKFPKNIINTQPHSSP